MTTITSVSNQSDTIYNQLDDIQKFQESDEKTIRIYFVRHGQSELNVLQNGIKFVQGQSPNVNLTKKGHEQAAKLAEKMASRMQEMALLILSSTARRAVDTAKPLQEIFNLKESTYKEFLELSSGKWEGTSKEDLDYVEDYNKWKDLSAHDKFSAPKVSTGESYSQVALRALEGLAQILAQLKGNQTVFIFSHNMLMNAVAISLSNPPLSNEPKSKLPELDIKNGDIMLVEIPRDAAVQKGSVKMVIHSKLDEGKSDD